MEKLTPMSAVLFILLLLLVDTRSSPLLASSSSILTTPPDSAHLRSLNHLSSSQYSSIFSPLLKALSEHGEPRWRPGLRRKMKPEHRYIKYLSQVYEKPSYSFSRVQRSLGRSKVYNTLRLIMPQDECLAQGSNENYMQDLSFSLDQVRRKEQLLKSSLLYNFDEDTVAPVNTVCYVSVKEQCQLCPVTHHAVNFTADGRSRSNWVEVDVTSFIKPLMKFQKKNVNLLINITCPDEQRLGGYSRKGPLGFSLRHPPLLLYLNDTSKVTVNINAGEKPNIAANAFHKQMVRKPEPKFGRKRRWKRQSIKSKRGDKSLELKSSSEFPTSDCALYDFIVQISRLKLDDWIVFPKKYNSRYCSGVCPRAMGSIYGSPVHTIVQNIIYEKLDSSVPRPSCIPSRYIPMSVVLWEKDGSIVVKEFENMVATRCTCR